ncbi:hypothetical protein B0H13DRAFT_2530312, partial [Mycena leptocephala]
MTRQVATPVEWIVGVTGKGMALEELVKNVRANKSRRGFNMMVEGKERLSIQKHASHLLPAMSSDALLTADYVNESHIRAFAEALEADADFHDRDASRQLTHPMQLPHPLQWLQRLPVFEKVRLLRLSETVSEFERMDFGLEGKKGLLRKRLRAARTYEDEWKKEDEDPFYDWKLVRKVHKSLKILRETFLGTKGLIESYFEEQEKALEFIRESPDLKIDEKKRFFQGGKHKS